jgi:hypothetical protein
MNWRCLNRIDGRRKDMPKPLATDADVIQLTDEFTWMGGNAGGIASLLREKQFTKSPIESAIANVMSRTVA